MTVLPLVLSARMARDFSFVTEATVVTTLTAETGRTTEGGAPPPETVLRPRRSLWPIDWRELRQYRDLLWFLGLRDVQVRYKQTLLGAGWAIIRPVVSMVVFTLLVGKVMGVAEMDDPVYVYAGLIPWTFFAAFVTAATTSLVTNAALVQKVYCPRLLLPLSAAGAPLVDCVMGLAVLAVMMPLLGAGFGWQLLLVGPLLGLTVLASVAIGVGLAAMTGYYRDVRHATPFLIQTMFFLTPVIYPRTIVPAEWRWLYLLNPMSGPIEGFRAAVLGAPVDWLGLGASGVVSVACLTGSLMLFGSMQRKLADVV